MMRGRIQLGSYSDHRKSDLYDALFNCIVSLDTEETASSGDRDVLHLQRLATLAELIGVSLDDTSLYRLAWGWGCQLPLCITRLEFTRGMQQLCDPKGFCGGRQPKASRTATPPCHGSVKVETKFDPCLGAIFSFVSHLDEVLHADRDQFRQFYRFVFRWVRVRETTARSMGEVGVSIETAVELWRMLFPEYRLFPQLEDWITFCTTRELFRREAISKDLWEQLLEFTAVTRYDTYDVNDAWPSAIDDFVEWYKVKEKK